MTLMKYYKAPIANEKVQQLLPPVDFQQTHQVMPLTTEGLDSN
jgi:hypothetical protein